ncbi:MAG TPA: ubiquinol-cytochrome c reductase iron-sulfur subunit [Chloroflexota bacterium]|jgi:menaquinol-cytochrome c reductase iron-sulfur subunit
MIRMKMGRNAFMKMTIAGVGAVGSLVAGIPIIGVVASPLFNQPQDVWRDAGTVNDFTIGDTVRVNIKYNQGLTQSWAGSTKYTSAWVMRRGPEDFIAFINYCTHLGCGVTWIPGAHIYLCPCHGSVYNADGTVAGGPAPRPLFRYEVRVRKGRVEVRTQHMPLVNV